MIFVALAIVAGGCRTAGSENRKDTQAGKSRLVTMLRKHRVELGPRPQSHASLLAALAAFEGFASLPAEGLDLAPEAEADALLFEVGTYDFGDAWGETMVVSLTRQYSLRNGDIWHTNLAAHFPAELWSQVRDRLSVRSCGDDETCATRCVYGGEDDISRIALGDRCAITARAAGEKPAKRLESVLLWSYDTDRETWPQRVRDSAVFDAIVTRRTPVLGYELWHGSVE